jgi:tetratricopeptide (TPR) repeat protein
MPRRGKQRVLTTVPMGTVVVCALTLLAGCATDPSALLRQAARVADDGTVVISNPLDSALFPPEAPAPTIRWRCMDTVVGRWGVGQTDESGTIVAAALVDTPCWRPTPPEWEAMKRASRGRNGSIVVAALSRANRVLHTGRVSYSTSPDSVKDALFYREVNLPFVEAVKDPSLIRWRFGSIAGPSAPPVVLTGLPVCGNCHSFSADGTVLGMDVDYANDKGSYAVVAAAPDIVLSRDEILTWSDYRREDGRRTFGLLSQVSPDGRYVISTVKDRSVFVPMPDLSFSQLFFPVQGILAVYDSDTRTIRALPGADDSSFVQSNPSWSPDGRTIVFARAPVHRLRGLKQTADLLLSTDECSEFVVDKKPFRFDLYRVPFNGGAGGTAEPLPGASNNGKSNYFARYSPDGAWIVFCQSSNYMLLQPDSRLYIVPAGGGEPRLMRCNRDVMNSWHSWSSNSRWLVFASKDNGPYTQLYLTHIDSNGVDAVPVLLEHLTQPDRAANIPEFTPLSHDAIRTIREQFVDDVSWVRAAREYSKAGGYVDAARRYTEALKLNPKNARAHEGLGLMLVMQQRLDEATAHFRTAAELDPGDPDVHYSLGMALSKTGAEQEAADEYRTVVRLDPTHWRAYRSLGNSFHRRGMMDSALSCYRRVISIMPTQPDGYFDVAVALHRTGRVAEAGKMYLGALEADSAHGPALYNYGVMLHEQNRIEEAIGYYRKALNVEPANALAYYSLAQALHGQGKPAHAIPFYVRALELKPSLAAARRQLAEAKQQAAYQATHR